MGTQNAFTLYSSRAQMPTLQGPAMAPPPSLSPASMDFQASSNFCFGGIGYQPGRQRWYDAPHDRVRIRKFRLRRKIGKRAGRFDVIASGPDAFRHCQGAGSRDDCAADSESACRKGWWCLKTGSKVVQCNKAILVIMSDWCGCGAELGPLVAKHSACGDGLGDSSIDGGMNRNNPETSSAVPGLNVFHSRTAIFLQKRERGYKTSLSAGNMDSHCISTPLWLLFAVTMRNKMLSGLPCLMAYCRATSKLWEVDMSAFSVPSLNSGGR